MKKVLIIQQIIPEYREDFFNLLKAELANNDIELSLIYSNKSSSYKYGYYKVDWGQLIINKNIRFLKMEVCWQPVLKYIRGNDLVIVEAANRLILNYFLMIAKFFWKTRLGFWGHGRNLQARPNSLGNKFSSLFIKRCDWWWAYTKGVKDFLVDKKFPADRITIVQNAIDTADLRKQIAAVGDKVIDELISELGIAESKAAIFCGGMYAEKRVGFILESCYIIKKAIPEFQMIFIGSGAESDKVQKAADANKWIHYLGVINGKERVKYFKVAAIQLMPGAVGLGILDSFALETPIITTHCGTHGPEIEYLENNKNGIITKNTLEDYSQTVIEILKSGKYLDLINGCITSANVYTVKKMVENFNKGILMCLN